MDWSLTKLAGRLWNSPTFTTWGQFGAKVINLVLVTPLILRIFPAEEVSVWFLFTSIIALANLIDLGFLPTISRMVAFVMGGATDIRGFRNPDAKVQNLDTPDRDLLRKLVSNSNLIYLVLGVAELTLLATLGTLMLKTPMSQLADPTRFWYAWFIICGTGTVVFYGRRFTSILVGMNYVSAANRIQIFAMLGSIISSFIVLYTGGDILALVIVQQLFGVLAVVLARRLLGKLAPDLVGKGLFHYDKEIFSAAWAPAWRSAIGILGSVGVTQASGVIFAQFGDSETLASYLLSLRVMTLISQFSQAPFYSKVPVFSRLRAEQNLQELKRQTASAMNKSLLVFVVGVSFTGFLAQFLLGLIESNTSFVSNPIWIAMSFIWYLERHHAMHAQVYSTTNHIPFHIPIIISGSINLAISILAVKTYGVWAFIGAHFISNLLINNWWNVRISLRSIKSGFYSYFRQSALLPTLALIFALLILYLAPNWPL